MTYLLSSGYVLSIILAYRLIKYLRRVRIPGPPSPSFIFGHTQEILHSLSPADLYDSWAQTYGGVFQLSGPLGTDRLILCDPKAIAHVYALDSWKYCHSPLAIKQLTSLTGPKSLLATVGEEHRRQRRILNPVFGSAALKMYSSIMYDSAYKVCPFTRRREAALNIVSKVSAAWESELQASNRLDIIGLAAFAHEFKSLDGEPSVVLTALTALEHSKPSTTVTKIFLLAQTFPALLRLPLPRSRHVKDLSNSIDTVIDGLLAKSNQNTDTSALVNAKELTANQVRVHVRVLESHLDFQALQLSSKAKSILLAGFATSSSASLCSSRLFTDGRTACRYSQAGQDRLRTELSPFTTADPSYDDLGNGLPYLDAIVRENLRLHPVLSDSTRVALTDNDVIPLLKPIRMTSGQFVDKLPIRKGTVLMTSLVYTNVSKTIWGDDAAEFRPERWLDGIPASAKVYPGYHHTMSFLEGPKTCLGKGFALDEIKVVLSVLIRKFVFSPKNGMETKYEKAFFLGPHPKVAGELGGRLPMRVMKVE
ncbi:cytochrome P450 [Mycena filopes]|nr:cytochrome P450 [Mycena filopes]